MMSLYHQIFVKSSFNENNLDALNSHMLNDDFFNSLKKEETIEVTIDEIEQSKPTIMERNDPLFWLMYISIYGSKEYEIMQNGFDNLLMNEKQKIGSFFSSHPNLMKNVNTKLTKKDVQIIISNIMTNNEVDTLMLYAFSIYYKRSIILTNKRSYLHIKPDEFDSTIIILKSKDGYGFDNSLTEEYIIKNYFCMNKHDQSMMAISKYKVSDLKSMMEETDLKIFNDDKKTIYFELNRYYNW